MWGWRRQVGRGRYSACGIKHIFLVDTCASYDVWVSSEKEMTMTYDEFLIALFRAPHATACSMMERRAGEFGKSVRECSADFKAKFGVYL